MCDYDDKAPCPICGKDVTPPEWAHCDEEKCPEGVLDVAWSQD